MTPPSSLSATDWSRTRAAMRIIGQTHLKLGGSRAELKADGSWVTAVDLAVQQAMREWLGSAFPRIGFLGEEMSAEEQAAAWQTCVAGDALLWVVDPLDGTSNFRAGFPVFSLTLALFAQGRVIAGLVYDPLRDELFHAQFGQGAYLNDTRLNTAQHPTLPLNRCLAAVDFKRLPKPLAARLAAEPPFASQRSIGSVALDWCWLATGRVQVYLHGKQSLWDYAAGQLIAFEAGARSAHLAGEPDAPNATATLTPRSALAALTAPLLDEWLSATRV